MKKARLLALLAALPAAGTSAEVPPRAEGCEVTRVTTLRDPQALAFDTDGTLYVASSRRNGASEINLRQFPGWRFASLKLTTVAEREAFYRKKFPAWTTPRSGFLEDFNRDGRVDHRDLGVLSEDILRFEPSLDAKSRTVFATDFLSEVTGVAGGVIARHGEVHALVSPDLWRFRGADENGHAGQREKLLTGFGVHLGSPGHDARGLVRGPDGKLYWVTGDKGMSVIAREGYPVIDPDDGCVVRCDPDGSHFEVYARGLRDMRQIVFDDFGNLFGVDNHEDGGHLLFLAEGSDAGWRGYYQSRRNDQDPWREPRPAFAIAPLRVFPGAISSLARSPLGTYFAILPEQKQMISFELKPWGASFDWDNRQPVVEDAKLSLASFGPDGAIYVTGEAEGRQAPLWRMNFHVPKNVDRREETKRLLKDGTRDIPVQDLIKRLEFPDQRVRLEAQWKLVERPEAVPALLAAVDHYRETPLPLAHALWALSARQAFDQNLFHLLLHTGAPECRAQAAKWAAACQAHGEEDRLAELLRDHSVRVRYEAAIALGKLHDSRHLQQVMDFIANDDGRDPLLFHAGVCALRGIWAPDVIEAGQHDKSASVRLAVVVSLRTRQPLSARAWLDDRDMLVASEAVRTIYDAVDDTFNVQPSKDNPSGPELLAAKSFSARRYSTAAFKRILASQRKMGRPEDAASLAITASDQFQKHDVQLFALDLLAGWLTEPKQDLIDGRPCRIAAGRVPEDIRLRGFTRRLDEISNSKVPELAEAARRTFTALSLHHFLAPAEWLAISRNIKLPLAERLAALDALASDAPEQLASHYHTLLSDASPQFRYRAARLLAPHRPFLIQDFACEVLERSKDQDDLDEACGLLGILETPDISQRIGYFIDRARADHWRKDTLKSLLAAGVLSAVRHPDLVPNLERLEKIIAATDQ